MKSRRDGAAAALLCVLVLVPLPRSAADGLHYFPPTGHWAVGAWHGDGLP